MVAVGRHLTADNWQSFALPAGSFLATARALARDKSMLCSWSSPAEIIDGAKLRDVAQGRNKYGVCAVTDDTLDDTPGPLIGLVLFRRSDRMVTGFIARKRNAIAVSNAFLASFGVPAPNLPDPLPWAQFPTSRDRADARDIRRDVEEVFGAWADAAGVVRWRYL